MGSLTRKEKYLLVLLTGTLFIYLFVMDVKLYRTLQSTTIVQDKDMPVDGWSPFRPLSMKLLMTDHIGHYVITPLSEFFNKITGFSDIFPFITPNVVTFTHLIVGFISARFVCSESLTSRRAGAVLYEFRTFLDSFDGTLYRARAKNKRYVSDHSNFGFWVDSTCDVIAGFAICFAVLFYFWWYWVPTRDLSLPYKNGKSPSKTAGENGFAQELHPEPSGKKPSKLYMFWMCLCFGITISIGSGCWDSNLQKYEKVFSTKFEDSAKEALQTEYLHSTMTCIIIWLWRFFECQAVFHIFLLMIFIDKIWEFIKFVQYSGIVLLLSIYLLSEYHIRHIQQDLGL